MVRVKIVEQGILSKLPTTPGSGKPNAFHIYGFSSLISAQNGTISSVLNGLTHPSSELSYQKFRGFGSSVGIPTLLAAVEIPERRLSWSGE